jgi:lipopolysaccharide export system protein LptA
VKTALLLISVLGFAVLAGGQTAPKPTFDEPISARADTMTRIRDTMQLRGNVRLQRGVSVVLADEADIRLDANGLPAGPTTTIDLRGNVRLEVPVNQRLPDPRLRDQAVLFAS